MWEIIKIYLTNLVDLLYTGIIRLSKENDEMKIRKYGLLHVFDGVKGVYHFGYRSSLTSVRADFSVNGSESFDRDYLAEYDSYINRREREHYDSLEYGCDDNSAPPDFNWEAIHDLIDWHSQTYFS